MAAELFGMLGRVALRCSLRLCCVPEETIEGIERRHMRRDSGARLICYLDGVSDELVKRQLEFRRSRKLERSASKSSLSSLDIVSEESPLELALHSGGLMGDFHGLRRNVSTPAMGSLYAEHGRMRHASSHERLARLGGGSMAEPLLLEPEARRERTF